MATSKKTAKKATKTSAPRRKPAHADAAVGDAPPQSISESAQQIWLAGVGAFGRAQAEGTRLFEGLMKEGAGIEKSARTYASTRASAVRTAVETGADQTRERAIETWDRLEKVFEDRVQRALVKLGVPGRHDVQSLSRRVDALTAALQAKQSAPARKAAKAPAKKAAAKKAAPRKTAKTSKAPAKRATKKSANAR
ncbi:phasin family protein [Luteimonas sp. 3794]|uniref:phasin family protein n=1 Tax=Luteimonas sp. 3794 TaxID=2817730 RepID=UPI00285CCA4B|nr:phasin family protein [Luteimonas sp. 3794]MDR6990738.1 poly(hydroxyalkanoate) granule-associated protein [Luteimonas sp. 3794]